MLIHINLKINMTGAIRYWEGSECKRYRFFYEGLYISRQKNLQSFQWASLVNYGKKWMFDNSTNYLIKQNNLFDAFNIDYQETSLFKISKFLFYKLLL